MVSLQWTSLDSYPIDSGAGRTREEIVVPSKQQKKKQQQAPGGIRCKNEGKGLIAVNIQGN